MWEHCHVHHFTRKCFSIDLDTLVLKCLSQLLYNASKSSFLVTSHLHDGKEDRDDDWWKMALLKGKSEKQKVKSYLMESEKWKVTLWKQPSPSQTSPRAPPTSLCLTPRWCQRGKPDCNYDQALLGMWVELICVLSTLHFNSLFYFNISILSFISTHQFLYFNIFILYFILTFQFCTLLWHINDSLLFFKI